MPSYHTVFNEKTNHILICGIPYLEFKQNKIPDMDSEKLKLPLNEIDLDIIDEALIYFRANVLFKNFPIKGDADKNLIYITVFISKCLEVALNQEPDKAKQAMSKLVEDCDWNLNLKNHFFTNLVTVKPSELPELQMYLKALRKETLLRLCYILYDSDSKTLDLKYWLGFAKKKFMGFDMPIVKK